MVASITKRTADPPYCLRLLRAVDEHFFLRWLVVRDGLERYMRDDAAEFFTLRVLLALIDKPAGWTAGLVGEVIPRVGGGEEALPRAKPDTTASRLAMDVRHA